MCGLHLHRTPSSYDERRSALRLSVEKYAAIRRLPPPFSQYKQIPPLLNARHYHYKTLDSATLDLHVSGVPVLANAPFSPGLLLQEFSRPSLVFAAMRLLQRREGHLHLTEDLRDNEIPPYAVLSHTWGDPKDEVNFKDMVEGTGRHKAGYEKIVFCGKQAARDDLQHFWVDICCINKSSSAELQEAIISMFRWYERATKCYVYLADVSTPYQYNQWAWEQAFRGSRWFTRGWTLQELLAPQAVEFFSREGRSLGDKENLENLVQEITRIDVRALRGIPISHFKTNERFLWAKIRHTTRGEDEAYSLLGIFGITMPIMYGEGRERAMNRLRHEIHKEENKGMVYLYKGKIDLCSAKSSRNWTAKCKIEGDKSAVYSVAFSPDGMTLASAGFDMTVGLWNARYGVALQTLKGHKSCVYCVAFSPDGTKLASAGRDSIIQLWNVWSGAALQTLRGHRASVLDLAFSPDGTMLVSAGGDGTVRFWGSRSGAALQTLTSHGANNVHRVAFSPDGTTLASAGGDGAVRLWDSRSRAALRTLKNRQGGNVLDVTFSPDGTTLAVVGVDGIVRFWNSQSREALHTLEVHEGIAVYGIAFSPNGTLASAGGDGTIMLWG